MRKIAPLLCCLFLCGCDAMFAGSPSAGKKTSPTKPATETVFTVLAENVAADPMYYATTDDVRRTVARLLATGRITQSQADSVTEIVGEARRPLTQKDIDAIRSL